MNFTSLLLPLLLAASPSSVTKFEVDGDVRAIRFADLDGDGDLDALLTIVRESGSDLVREVRVHLRSGAGLGEVPAGSIEVSNDVLFVDTADLDGDGAAELLNVDTSGLSAVRWGESGFRAPLRLVEVPSFFRATASTELKFVEIARDIDLDGRSDLLLPGRAGYVLCRARDGGDLDGPYALDTEFSHGVSHGQNVHFRLTSRLARPTPIDWEGDGVGDLLLAFEQQLLRVVLSPTGPPGPAKLLLDMSEVLAVGELQGAGLTINSGRLADVDGDGRCDLVLTDRVARPSLLAGIATRTILFLSADLNGRGPPKPRQVIRTDGVTSPPRLFDLDTDGALDLIVTTVRTDLFSKLKESILNTVQVTFFVYRFDRESKRFEDEPVFSETLEMPVDRVLDVGAYGWVTFRADYDGDGRPDFATYDASSRSISVRKGYEKDSWFSSKPIAFEEDPFFSTRTELTGAFFGQDVDGDGCAEIVSCGNRCALILEVTP